jgi:hypothetical protein
MIIPNNIPNWSKMTEVVIMPMIEEVSVPNHEQFQHELIHSSHLALGEEYDESNPRHQLIRTCATLMLNMTWRYGLDFQDIGVTLSRNFECRFGEAWKRVSVSELVAIMDALVNFLDRFDLNYCGSFGDLLEATPFHDSSAAVMGMLGGETNTFVKVETPEGVILLSVLNGTLNLWENTPVPEEAEIHAEWRGKLMGTCNYLLYCLRLGNQNVSSFSTPALADLINEMIPRFDGVDVVFAVLYLPYYTWMPNVAKYLEANDNAKRTYHPVCTYGGYTTERTDAERLLINRVHV